MYKSMKLRWWVLFNSIVLGLVFLYTKNVLTFIWNSDVTKISFFTLAVFLLTSLFIGWLTIRTKWESSDGEDFREGTVGANTKYIEACWFISEFLMGLGILGTVCGIVMTFNDNMSGMDFNNPETIKTVTFSMSKSLTQAFVTTLMGVATSLLTKVQLVSYDVGTRE